MGQDVQQPLEADENLLAHLEQVENFSLFLQIFISSTILFIFI